MLKNKCFWSSRLKSASGLLAVAAFALTMSPLWGQSGRGTIRGSVADQSGAMVPGVALQIVQIDTNNTYDFQTNSDGLYLAPNLPAGQYKVTATKDGFATVVRQPVILNSQVQIQVDFVVQPGAVQQSISVEGDAPLLDVSTTGNTTGVPAEMLHEMPLTLASERRSVTQYLMLVPGLTGGLLSNNDGMWTPKMNGSVQGATEVFIDGARATSQGIQRGAVEETGPPVETAGEVTVVANAFNAEYGGFGSWFTQVTTKSGTNNFHGSLYDHFQNYTLNARSFFQPRVSPLQQNEGGGNLGGPVYIPKVYNGKNKTFFFVNQGAFIAHQGASGSLITVPTSEFKQGNFSHLVNASGAMIPIFDPASTAADGKGGFTRTQFAGNMIPASRISPQAAAILPYLNDPDLPGITNNAYSHQPGNQYRFFDIYNTTIKIDHSLSDRQKISLTYNYGNRYRDIEQYGYAAAPVEYHLLQRVTTHSGRFNHDYIFSASVLNHLTFAYDRYKNLGPDGSQGGGWDQKLGIAGIPNNASGAFPAISFSGGTGSPANMGRAYNQRWGEQHFTLDESLAWNKGKHSFKFGFFYATDGQNENQKGGDQGSFRFSNAQTSQPLNSANGNSFASFLLGAVNSASALFPTTAGMRYRKYAGYAQDAWRITNKFTLSYGLRYDYDSPGYEVNNHLSTFSPAAANPGAGNLPGALVFASGDSGFARSFVNPWRNGFSPRLGVAYQFNPKTVLRASAGIYYSAISESGSSTAGFNTTATFSSPDTFSPAYYWTEPFPNNYIVPPVKDPSFLNGQSITYLNSDGGRMPQTLSWTVGIQRELIRDLALDVAYIGSKTTHIAGFNSLNIAPIDAIGLGSVLLQQVGSAAATAAGFGSPFPGFTDLPTHTVAQSLKPYPQFTSVNFGTSPNPSGISKFNSLQIKATKRFSHGWQLLGFYSWENTMSTGPASQNPLVNRYQALTVDSSDIPSTLQISANFTLPFGPGRKFLNSQSSAWRYVVGGWSLTTSERYQSGIPLSINGSGSLSALGYGQTANYVGGDPFKVSNPREFNPATDRYLDSAAFRNPSAFAFGNLAPTLSWLRGFTQKYESISLSKTTPLSEKAHLELSLDAINPFNFHRWGTPNTSITSSNFGQVTSTSAVGGSRTLQINATMKF
jgi:hypothetical protein